MADLTAAETNCEGAVTGKIHEDQIRAWCRWREWCESVGIINDLYLYYFTKGQWIKLIGAFTMALHCRRYSWPLYGSLAEGTLRGAISCVAQTFRDNGHSHPTRDEDDKLCRLLSRQYRAFKNEDPNPVQQKGLPACVLREVKKKKSTETQQATPYGHQTHWKAIKNIYIWRWYIPMDIFHSIKKHFFSIFLNACM